MPAPRASRSACMFVYTTLRHDARIERESRALVDAGWNVRIVAASDPAHPTKADDAHELRGGVEIERVDRYPLPAKAVRRVRRAGGRAPTATAAPASMAAGGRPGPATRVALAGHLWLDHRKYLRRALAAARERPADVWICHDLDTLPAGAAAKRKLGGALVYDSHELWLDRNAPTHETAPERRRWRRMERSLIGAADAVVTASDSYADVLAERYSIERPAVVRNIPEASGGPAADLRGMVGIAPGRKLVLFLGGLQRGRGLEPLVRAVATLDGCDIVLLGPAEPGLPERLAALAGELGAADRVHVVPPVATSEVVAYARSADVGVAPIQNAGLSYFYSLPNKLFEYVHAGLPVVASDFPEMARLVSDHELGATCDPDDPESIARAIAYVLDDARHERLAANARATARELTWERESARYVAAIEALCE